MSGNADYSSKVLEVKNLKQHFKAGVGKNKIRIKAVDGVSFDVYKKEVFGLVGESGCGKTTTGRTIIRLYKPTSGTVTLNGNIIGSGSEHLFQLLKNKKREYAIDLLKLNPHNYEVYKQKEIFKKTRHDFEQQKVRLANEFKKAKGEIQVEKATHQNAVFDDKENYRVAQEKLLFAFRVQKDKLFKETMNEVELEYKNLVKGLEMALSKKLEGVKESAALSKEGKHKHELEIKNAFAAKLKAIEEETTPKIKAANEKIISKQSYQKQLGELKQQYQKDKIALQKEHKQQLAVLKASTPDKSKISAKLALLKAEFNKKSALIDQQIKQNLTLERETIKQIHLSKVVDDVAQKQLAENYKKDKQAIMNEIKASNTIQKSKEAEKHAKAMQMIFQDPISSLNPRMTVQEIISEGLVINGEKDKEFMTKEVIKMLELVGLAPEYISRYPHEFSGGQRQRIGIARALIMNPSIIIADEPISALDVSIKAQVINLLGELREKLDLSILFIAHDLSVVKFFCDRIAVMYFGKIVELASSEELFKNPLHGYTRSLLSAIPQPDPESEKKRTRIAYSPEMHDYRSDKPRFVEITPGHFVLANSQEVEEMKTRIGEAHEKK